jgi:hypothetical protein
MQYAAMHESGSGKKPTKRQGSMTSVVRGRLEVAADRQNRRD